MNYNLKNKKKDSTYNFDEENDKALKLHRKPFFSQIISSDGSCIELSYGIPKIIMKISKDWRQHSAWQSVKRKKPTLKKKPTREESLHWPTRNVWMPSVWRNLKPPLSQGVSAGFVRGLVEGRRPTRE